MKSIKSAGVIGAGVIGSGWIARFLLNGIDVYVYDPSTELRARLFHSMALSQSSACDVIE